MNIRYLFLCLFLLVGLEARASHEESFSFEESIYTSVNTASDELVIAFGGMGSGIGRPIFEFKTILSNFDVNLLLVRDLQRNFYYYGLEPNGNITQALHRLEEEIGKFNPKKIVIFGNSSGGYAALLFGFFLLNDGYPVEQVHAFSPRNKVRKRHRAYPNIQREFFHLRRIFANKSVPRGIFHLYYAMDNKADVRYTTTHLNLDWIKHRRFEKGGHQVIRDLKKEGILYEIIKETLNNSFTDIPAEKF